jgi:hypothetical protein
MTSIHRALCGLAAVIAIAGSPAGLAAPPAETSAKKYVAPRAFGGKPDLQGIWANNTATPLERPKMLEGRAYLTDEEVAALRKRYAEIFAGDGDAAFGDSIFEAVLSEVKTYKPTTFDTKTGNYNAFWLVSREFDNRTSLITDPPDGRLPPLTPEAITQRKDALAPARTSDGPETRGLSERCITFGVPDLLAGYNSYYQLVQGPDAVIFYSEKIHDARIVYLDKRPHAPTNVRTYVGDSRGHWEGDTLVVETVNLKAPVRGSTDSVRLVERFTRVGPDTLQHEITVDDPKTWTRPWTMMIPLKRTDEHIYEYACHEGNTAMVGILAGARAEEKATSAEGKSGQ